MTLGLVWRREKALVLVGGGSGVGWSSAEVILVEREGITGLEEKKIIPDFLSYLSCTT